MGTVNKSSNICIVYNVVCMGIINSINITEVTMNNISVKKEGYLYTSISQQ